MEIDIVEYLDENFMVAKLPYGYVYLDLTKRRVVSFDSLRLTLSHDLKTPIDMIISKTIKNWREFSIEMLELKEETELVKV